MHATAGLLLVTTGKRKTRATTLLALSRHLRGPETIIVEILYRVGEMYV